MKAEYNNISFAIHENDIENMDEANQLMVYLNADNIEMAIDTMRATHDNLEHSTSSETLAYCEWMTQRHLKACSRLTKTQRQTIQNRLDDLWGEWIDLSDDDLPQDGTIETHLMGGQQ